MSLLDDDPRVEWNGNSRRGLRGALDSAPPVFLVAPPRSFTSVLTSMLGQHPDLYALPETNLFITRELRQWCLAFRGTERLGGQGLLRAVAEVVFGAQTTRTVTLAREWLHRRLDWPCAAIFAALSARLLPSRVVEKSPWTASRPEYLRYMFACHPNASFLHIVRHPSTHGASMLRLFADIGIPAAQIDSWLDRGGDPQRSWWEAHTNILEVLAEVPSSQQLRLQGENALANIDGTLRHVCCWLGVTAEPTIISAMKHPEHSPFAAPGPPGATLGNDPGFLADPILRVRPTPAEPPPSLDAILPWDNRRGLEPEVRQLARDFGYS